MKVCMNCEVNEYLSNLMNELNAKRGEPQRY